MFRCFVKQTWLGVVPPVGPVGWPHFYDLQPPTPLIHYDISSLLWRSPSVRRQGIWFIISNCTPLLVPPLPRRFFISEQLHALSGSKEATQSQTQTTTPVASSPSPSGTETGSEAALEALCRAVALNSSVLLVRRNGNSVTDTEAVPCGDPSELGLYRSDGT